MPQFTTRGKIAPSQLTCKTCSFHGTCHFDQKQRGGFKDIEPRYIGYVLITDRVESNAANKNTMRCHDFIATGMQRRMEQGAILRAQGEDADIIRIIAQQGEEIEMRTNVSINSLGEVVRPQAEIIEALKAGGFKIAPDHSPSIGTKEITYTIKVPNYQHEENKPRRFSDTILMEEMQHQKDQEVAEDEVWQKMYDKGKTPGDLETDEDTLDMGEQEPKQEPMRRRKPVSEAT